MFAAGDSFSVREVLRSQRWRFLSVPEFAVNPLSQFWLGGRRYWGRGIGARPYKQNLHFFFVSRTLYQYISALLFADIRNIHQHQYLSRPALKLREEDLTKIK